MPSLDDRVREEVVRLHVFFEDWFMGRLPDRDEAFAPFADAMDGAFEIVAPDGALSALAPLTERLRGAHGLWAGAPQTIEIEKVRARRVGPGLIVATYVEVHVAETKRTSRLSSALLREADDAPGGFVWLHVHETWLGASD